jgi:hypothetical protein
MAKRACDQCGTKHDRMRSPFCTRACQMRWKRAHPDRTEPAGVDAQAALPSAPAASPHLGPVLMTTMTVLVEAKRHETPGGTAALALAMRIDHPYGETGSSLAALVREHRAALADALRGAAVKDDPIDELGKRRDEKLAG